MPDDMLSGYSNRRLLKSSSRDWVAPNSFRGAYSEIRKWVLQFLTATPVFTARKRFSTGKLGFPGNRPQQILRGPKRKGINLARGPFRKISGNTLGIHGEPPFFEGPKISGFYPKGGPIKFERGFWGHLWAGKFRRFSLLEQHRVSQRGDSALW